MLESGFGKKVLNLKITASCTNKCDAKTAFFIMAPFIKTSEIYSIILANFLAEDRRRDLLAELGKHAAGWKRPREQPRAALTRSAKNDLAPLHIGLYSDLKNAQDRTYLRRFVYLWSSSGMEFARLSSKRRSMAIFIFQSRSRSLTKLDTSTAECISHVAFCVERQTSNNPRRRLNGWNSIKLQHQNFNVVGVWDKVSWMVDFF